MNSNRSFFFLHHLQWNHICKSVSEHRQRACPIFRIEEGKFEENHPRTWNSEYPSLNEDEHVFLRVTKLSSANTSPLSFNKRFLGHGKNSLLNSSANNVDCRDSWDDADHSLNNPNRSSLTRSFSDDYVFL